MLRLADLILRALHLDDMCTDENLTSSLQPGLICSQPSSVRTADQVTVATRHRSKWSNLESPSPAQLATHHQQLLAKQRDNRRTPGRKRGLAASNVAPGSVTRQAVIHPGQSATSVSSVYRPGSNVGQPSRQHQVAGNGVPGDERSIAADDDDLVLQEAAEMCDILESTLQDDEFDVPESPLAPGHQPHVNVRAHDQPIQQPLFSSPGVASMSKATPARSTLNMLEFPVTEEDIVAGDLSISPETGTPPPVLSQVLVRSRESAKQTTCASPSPTPEHYKSGKQHGFESTCSGSQELVSSSHTASSTLSSSCSVAVEASDRQPVCEPPKCAVSSTGNKSTGRRFTFVRKPSSSLSGSQSLQAMPPPPPHEHSSGSSDTQPPEQKNRLAMPGSSSMSSQQHSTSYDRSVCRKEDSLSVTRTNQQSTRSSTSKRTTFTERITDSAPCPEALQKPLRNAVMTQNSSHSSRTLPLSAKQDTPAPSRDLVGSTGASAATKLSKFQFLSKPPQGPSAAEQQARSPASSLSIPAAKPSSVGSSHPASAHSASHQSRGKGTSESSQKMRAAIQALRATGNSSPQTSASPSVGRADGNSSQPPNRSQQCMSLLQPNQSAKSSFSQSSQSLFRDQNNVSSLDGTSAALRKPNDAVRRPSKENIPLASTSAVGLVKGTCPAPLGGRGSLFTSSAQALGIIDDEELDDMEWVLTPDS